MGIAHRICLGRHWYWVFKRISVPVRLFTAGTLQQITFVCFGFVYVCLCLFIYLFMYNTASLGMTHRIDLDVDRDVDTDVDIRDIFEEVTQHSDKRWHACTSRIHGADPTVKQITPKFKAKDKLV